MGKRGQPITLRKILILRNDDPPASLGESPDRRVVGVTQTCLARRLENLAVRFKKSGQRRRQLGIDQETHHPLKQSWSSSAARIQAAYAHARSTAPRSSLPRWNMRQTTETPLSSRGDSLLV